MKTYNIHTDTPLIPYIIAERALWNVMEGDERFKHYHPSEMAAIVEDHYPYLVSNAERLYKYSDHFRKQNKQ